MLLARVVGYFLAMAVVDLVVDTIVELRRRKMEREMKTYTNENGGTITAHVVTEDTAGTVITVGGVGRDVAPGDVLIGTDRPDVYHVADSSALEGYSAHDDSADADILADVEAEDSDQPDEFDPSKHTAADVRAYLRRMREDENRAEFERVTEAERYGLNRSSALDGDYER
jgi:hypothetical protein